ALGVLEPAAPLRGDVHEERVLLVGEPTEERGARAHELLDVGHEVDRLAIGALAAEHDAVRDRALAEVSLLEGPELDGSVDERVVGRRGERTAAPVARGEILYVAREVADLVRAGRPGGHRESHRRGVRRRYAQLHREEVAAGVGDLEVVADGARTSAGHAERVSEVRRPRS